MNWSIVYSYLQLFRVVSCCTRMKKTDLCDGWNKLKNCNLHLTGTLVLWCTLSKKRTWIPWNRHKKRSCGPPKLRFYSSANAAPVFLGSIDNRRESIAEQINPNSYFTHNVQIDQNKRRLGQNILIYVFVSVADDTTFEFYEYIEWYKHNKNFCFFLIRQRNYLYCITISKYVLKKVQYVFFKLLAITSAVKL